MLWPLGGFNDCTVPNGTCPQEFFIALSGPLMQLPLIFMWIGIFAVFSDDGYTSLDVDALEDGGGSEWVAQLAKRSLDLNVMIFCLNMFLPAYPMDAASMVAAICGYFGLSIVSTAWALVIIGTILGVACAVIGIIYLLGVDGPGIFLLLLGLYVLYTSWQMFQSIQAGNIHHHPLFKPDCYKKEIPQQTNLSNSNRAPSNTKTNRSGGDIETGGTKKHPAKKTGAPAKKKAPTNNNKS